MRNKITIFCIAASLLIILDSFNFGDALMMFLFVGIIPGINIQLSPEQMFALYSIATSLIIVHYLSPVLRKYNFASLKLKQNKPKTKRLKRV